MTRPQFSDDELGSMLFGTTDTPAFCTECWGETEIDVEPDFDDALHCPTCCGTTLHKSALRLQGIV